MSGLFGGRPQTEAAATNSAPTLPAYLQPYEIDAASKAQGLYNSGQLAPAYYPGSTVAPQSADTLGAFDATRGLANGGQPGALQTAADAQQLGTINGNQLDASSNPYLRSAMDAANQGTIDQFRDSTAPTLLGNFSGGGRLSSGATGNVYGQAAGKLANTLSNSNATMAYNNYNDAANRQQAASQYAPQLAQGDFANANKLQTSGALQDEYGQNLTDASVDKYNYNASLPQNALTNYLQLLNGTAGSVGNGTTSTDVKYGAQSRTQSTLTSAAQLAALFSDRRLKVNIKREGKMPNGLNTYSYEYVWGGPRIAGVMADEVEALMPEAVVIHASGFKQVNYGAL